MKVAFVRQKYSDAGGAERDLQRLAERLLAAGHEVHIVAREWPGADSGELVFHRIECPARPTSKRLRGFARGAAAFLARERFDAVHGFERMPGLDIFQAADGCHREWLARRSSVGGPFQVWADRVNPRHRAWLDLERRMFTDPGLKAVIALSEQGRDEIVRHYGFPADRIRVIYNGVDRARFHPGLKQHRQAVRAELGLADDEPVALFVGSGYRRKGLTDLIKAMPRLPVRVLVAGRDHAGPYIRLAKQLGVAGRLTVLGPRSDVERLYGAADVFVLPSWYEPFGNVVLEALASGLPVVTSRLIGAAEAIEEGANGYLHDFPPDPDELADKIGLALKLDRGRLMETNGRILERFDWNRNVAETISLYESVAEGR